MSTLHVPIPIMDDGLPDDRVKCGTCRHCDDHRFFCRSLRMATWGDLPVRCMRYIPRKSEADQRTGQQRWPDLQLEIEDIRRIEREAAKK